MTAYYNEFDPKAAAWLRQLIKNGVIAPGEVDERSIIDVSADDLAGSTQHHFFAGVGVWSYALRSAGWSDDSPVCTASLPCQPFSAAGKRLGKDDERHLLPHFLDLVSQCGFNTIIGEQVASAIRAGWLDDLHTEMEAQGYAVGHAVLGAHSAGSFHQRQRLYWVAERVADSNGKQRNQRLQQVPPGQAERAGGDSVNLSLGDTDDTRPQEHGGFGKLHIRQSDGADSDGLNIDAGVSDTAEGRMGNTEHNGQSTSTFTGSHAETVCNGKAGAYSASESEGAGPSGIVSGEFGGLDNPMPGRHVDEKQALRAGRESTFIPELIDDIDWLYCRDEKYRAVKSGLKPLVDGSAEGVGYSGDPSQPIDADYSSEARVMRLKGYGNAIHAGTAQMFIDAFMESLPDI